MRTAWLLLVVVLAACATYDERLADVHRAFYGGRVQEAADLLAERLVDDAEDRQLLQLELAMARQAEGDYVAATKLLGAADQHLEVLDYSTDAVADIAAYSFAPEARAYQASPPERVMLNTQNMLNYLALDEPREAAVEARRLRLILTQEDIPEEERFANAFAWGLAGLSFEVAGDLAESLEAYRDADDSPLESLEPATGQTLPDDPAVPPGVILVVAQTGKAPIRKQAVYLLFFEGQLHRLNVPTLVSRPDGFTGARVSLDGVDQGEAPLLFDLGAHLRTRFEQEFPRLLAAAATQLLPRVVTARSIREGFKDAAKDRKPAERDAAEAVGSILGSLVEWIWAAATGTDTRCWTLLPDQYRALRLNVAPGAHTVRVELTGPRGPRSIDVDVTVRPGRLALVLAGSGPYEGYAPVAAPRGRDLSGTTEGEQALRALEQALLLREVIAD